LEKEAGRKWLKSIPRRNGFVAGIFWVGLHLHNGE